MQSLRQLADGGELLSRPSSELGLSRKEKNGAVVENSLLC